MTKRRRDEIEDTWSSPKPPHESNADAPSSAAESAPNTVDAAQSGDSDLEVTEVKLARRTRANVAEQEECKTGCREMIPPFFSILFLVSFVSMLFCFSVVCCV